MRKSNLVAPAGGGSSAVLVLQLSGEAQDALARPAGSQNPRVRTTTV